jgi:glycosyltransferase involved in cell wall biosynthesis
MTPPAPRGRLLYVITSPVSTRLLRGQLRWMGGVGFEVHLACGDGPDLDAFAADEGVTVHRLPLVRPPRPVADLRALVATFQLVRRLEPAIVNASTPKAGLLGMLAARAAGVPVRVYVIRGLRFEGEVGRRRTVLRAFDRLAARSANHVLANSPSLLDLAVREGVVAGGAGEVLGSGSGNGVDIRRFADRPARGPARRALGLPDDGPVIGFVGRLTRSKGIDDLLRAFDVVAAQRPDARLLLVGGFEPDDPVGSEVRHRIEHAPRVHVVGWVEDTTATYGAIDVLAFPSYREGLPNVVLEAQAAGVPVVAYAATGTCDAVRPGTSGVLVAVGDVDGMASALGALLDDEARRAAFGAAGRRWVEATFAPERVWGALAERYLAWTAEAPDRRRGSSGSVRRFMRGVRTRSCRWLR